MRIFILLSFAMMVTANVVGMPSEEELKMDFRDDIVIDDIAREPKGLESQSQLRSRAKSGVPSRLCINVKVFYNRPFKNFVRNSREMKQEGLTDPEEVIRRMFSIANQVYMYPGLDTKISLKLIGKPTFVSDRVADKWKVGQSRNWLDHKSVLKRLDNSADHFAFICYTDSSKGPVASSKFGSVCKAAKDRSSIYQFTSNINATAHMLAHEIGHALGMKHDKNHEGGEDCKVGGVMGFSNNKYKWSKCSKKDLENHWNKVGGKNCMKCRG